MDERVRRTNFDYITLQLNHIIRKTYGGWVLGNRFWYLISARRILGPGALGPYNFMNPVENFIFTYGLLHADGTNIVRSLTWRNMKTRNFPNGLGIGGHIFTDWNDLETTFNNILRDEANYSMYADHLIGDMVRQDVANIIRNFTQRKRKKSRRRKRR